jgi:ribosomal protein S18 acetylase RimI-like enzyme
MTTASIRVITPAEAFPMRRYLLRPMLASQASRYPGDDLPGAVHLGAFADLGGGDELVGIVSFLPQTQEGEFNPQVYQLQGMVTLPAVRNEGIGARLADYGMTLLRERKAEEIWCNARTPAAPFYERLGFSRVGAEFITPGTGPHYRFVCYLDS